MKPCKQKKCKTCPSFDPNPLFKSTVTGSNFILLHDKDFSCKTKNLIYLITCNTCNIQYVGLTETEMHSRMNKHRSKINKSTFNSVYIVQHFSKEGHNFKEARIQIIDYILENENLRVLKNKENFWINTLNTAYPLGLNDNIRGFGNVSQGNAGNVYFLPSKIPRYKRGRGKRGKKSKLNRTTLDSDNEFFSLKEKFDFDKRSFFLT